MSLDHAMEEYQKVLRFLLALLQLHEVLERKLLKVCRWLTIHLFMCPLIVLTFIMQCFDPAVYQVMLVGCWNL